MLWTAEAVEHLKRLALEGKSASSIAAALGVGSRNAVIGKASRIGIKLNGGGRANCIGQDAGGRASVAMGDCFATRRPAPASRRSAAVLARDPQVTSEQVRQAAWTFGEAEIGEMRRLRFEEIREFACRWPLGDPRSGEFAYCGLTPAEGPVLLRRPLPDGLSAAERRGEAERARAARVPRAREFVAAGLSAKRQRAAPSSRTRRSGREPPRPLRAASTPTGGGAVASPPRARSSRRRAAHERTASSARA